MGELLYNETVLVWAHIHCLHRPLKYIIDKTFVSSLAKNQQYYMG